MSGDGVLFFAENVFPAEVAERYRDLLVNAEYSEVKSIGDYDYPDMPGDRYQCFYDRSQELELDDRFQDINRYLTSLFEKKNKQQMKMRIRAHRMLPGHFFREHQDSEYSVIYYLCRNWRSDWGGLLMVDQKQIIVPKFNSVAVIKPKVMHSVSPIGSYAKEPRYSVTGFLV